MRSRDTVGPATPTPLVNTYVIKVASRCNLACTYCYVYSGPDTLWRELPKSISIETLEQSLHRVGEYSKSNNLQEVALVFHGGEPLLLRPKRLRDIFEACERVLARYHVAPGLYLQTNATLINEQHVLLFEEYDVQVGVSIDSSPESHDRRRVDHAGRGTHDQVCGAVAFMQEHSGGKLPFSVNGVIDFSIEPETAFAHLTSYGVMYGDLVLPDLNHDSAGTDIENAGEWLVRLYREYMRSPIPFRMRTFQTLLQLASGSRWGSDAWGALASGTVIIETDGGLHYHDFLKMTADRRSHSGLDVWSSTIQEIAAHDDMVALMEKHSGADPKCLSCGYFQECGGGQLAHRYSTQRQFQNPSVYCTAIEHLLSNIRQDVAGFA